MEKQEALVLLKGLMSEFTRKGEEIWSRGLDYGYESATNEFERIAKALDVAVKQIEQSLAGY